MKTKTVDVAIVGPGVIGLSLALSLMRAWPDFKIAVIGPMPKTDAKASQASRQLALNPRSLSILNELGVMEMMDKQAIYAYDRMEVWDEGSAGEISFTAASVGCPSLGSIVSASALVASLHQRAKEHEGIQFFSDYLQQLRSCEAGYDLDLVGGQKISARLVVGADGSRSCVADQVGLDADIIDYQQTALVAQLTTDKKHQSTAYQRFLAGGPLAFLPLAHAHGCSMVWSMPHDEAKLKLQMDQVDLGNEIACGLEHRLGQVTVVSEVTGFPLKALKRKQMVLPHLALIGDAAHVVHPLAGQGANLGFYDVQVLMSQLIQGQQQGRPLGSLKVLMRYQKTSQAYSGKMTDIMTSMHWMFGLKSKPWSRMRGMGVSAVDRAAVLKKACIEMAMGVDSVAC